MLSRKAWITLGLLALTSCGGTCGKRSVGEVAPPAKIAGAGAIACGDAECTAGKEVCCNDEGRLRCVAADPKKLAEVPPNPYLVLGACDRTKPDGGPFAAAMCDDSADCKGGALCCPGQLSGRYLGCMAGPQKCFGLESCREGTCRTPGTSCLRGLCRPPTGTVACGSLTCGGDRPVCCFQQTVKLVTEAGVQEAPPLRSCVARDAPCPSFHGIARFECDDRSDCGSMRCCSGADDTDRGTTCSPSCRGTTTCKNDVDCADPDVELFHGESLGDATFRCRNGSALEPAGLQTCELSR